MFICVVKHSGSEREHHVARPKEKTRRRREDERVFETMSKSRITKIQKSKTRLTYSPKTFIHIDVYFFL